MPFALQLRPLMLSLCLLAAVSSAASARSFRGHNGWLTIAQGMGPLKRWVSCDELSALPGVQPEKSGLASERVAVRSNRDGLDVCSERSGTGRWAYRVVTVFRLRRRACAAAGFVIEGGAESLIGGLRRFRIGNAPGPSWTNLPGVDEPTVVSSPDAGELAAARILVQLAREDEGEPSPPRTPAKGMLAQPWPIQPEHAGRPRGSPAAQWSLAALRAAGVAKPWLKNEDDEAFEAIYTWPVREPVPFATRGRWQLWEHRFGFRRGGGVLAVYDPRADRHRWIWATEYDNRQRMDSPANHFDVLLFEGDLLLVRNVFDDRQYLWAIDVARGVTRQVAVGEEATFRLLAGGVAVRREGGRESVVALSSLRP